MTQLSVNYSDTKKIKTIFLGIPMLVKIEGKLNGTLLHVSLKNRRITLQNELSFSSLIFKQSNETSHLPIWHKICCKYWWFVLSYFGFAWFYRQ